MLNFIFQDASPCSVKTDGLKRGLHSIESADYQMGEAITGILVQIFLGNISFSQLHQLQSCNFVNFVIAMNCAQKSLRIL